MASSDEFDPQVSDLEISARKGNLTQVQNTVENWSSPANLQESIQSALWHAVRGRSVPVASYLLSHGAKFTSDISSSILASNTSEGMYQLALDHGWDINSTTDFGIPVFASAVQSQSLPLVRWFLAHGADPVLRGTRAGVPGAHMLDVAAASSSPVILDLLIDHGLKLSDSDALHSAAGAVEAPPGRIEMMGHLLDLGMDINAIEKVGMPESTDVGRGTPLHSAVYIDDSERVTFLLQRGADKKMKNEFGEEAVRFAETQESWKTLEVLQG